MYIPGLSVSEINRLAGVSRAGRKRLFDLSLSFERHDYAASFGASHLNSAVMLNNGFEQTPLSVYVLDYSASQDIQIDFSYNLAYFDAEDMARLQQRFTRLLEDVLAHPDTPICALDILPPAERRQLLVDWNATAAPLPEVCIHQLFEMQAVRTPEATAVVFEDEALTYAELNAQANQLAHALIALGGGPEALVAIALERSPAMVVALLATLKAGGAYVPLDPDYPAERLAFMLEDSGAKLLITQASLRPRLPQTAAHILCVNTTGPEIATRPKSNPDRPVNPAHLAYVIYTSGSTGKPKGVAVSIAPSVTIVESSEISTGSNPVIACISSSRSVSTRPLRTS